MTSTKTTFSTFETYKSYKMYVAYVKCNFLANLISWGYSEVIGPHTSRTLHRITYKKYSNYDILREFCFFKEMSVIYFLYTPCPTYDTPSPTSFFTFLVDKLFLKFWPWPCQTYKTYDFYLILIIYLPLKTYNTYDEIARWKDPVTERTSSIPNMFKCNGWYTRSSCQRHVHYTIRYWRR